MLFACLVSYGIGSFSKHDPNVHIFLARICCLCRYGAAAGASRSRSNFPWLRSITRWCMVDILYGGVHSHGGTPSSLDGLVQGKSHRSKWMITRGTPISGNLHLEWTTPFWRSFRMSWSTWIRSSSKLWSNPTNGGVCGLVPPNVSSSSGAILWGISHVSWPSCEAVNLMKKKT